MLIIDNRQHSINVKKHSNAGTQHCQTISIQDLFQNSTILGNKVLSFQGDPNSLQRGHLVCLPHCDKLTDIRNNGVTTSLDSG